MGYGLWLSKLLTERHGGRLDYRHDREGGAAFTVRLDARPDGMPAEIRRRMPPRNIFT